MSAITLQPRITSRIKPPPSQRRHLWQAGAFIVVAALVALIAARYFRHEDVSHLHELAQFSSRYATECDVPEFNAPLSPLVRDAYLHSHVLQQVVERQTAALAAGASCDEVPQALRAADFPAPLPARLPTIRLRPSR
jgi:hypothetical protein